MSGERIQVIEGLEVIRRRPAMFIGPERPGAPRCAQLVEMVLSAFAHDTPAPTAARLIAWADRAITIALDGEPFSIAPLALDGVAHPSIYGTFMHLAHRGERNLGGTVLSALSDRLVVWTVQDEGTYRVAFTRGALLTLLVRTGPPYPPRLGSTWMTFVPDETLISGRLDAASGAAVIAAIAAQTPGVQLSFEDRSEREPDWW